jgi:hypothetical protein
MNLNSFDVVSLGISPKAHIDQYSRSYSAEVDPPQLRIDVPGKQNHRNFVDPYGVGCETIIRALEIQEALL